MSLENIPVKNHLYKDLKLNDVKNKIIDRIKTFPNYEKYKNDVEFLGLVCNMIEHLVIKKDKIDKKNLLLEIYKNVFPLDENELDNISLNVEYLWNNKKIKKMSYFKVFLCGLSEWIKKKFL